MSDIAASTKHVFAKLASAHQQLSASKVSEQMLIENLRKRRSAAVYGHEEVFLFAVHSKAMRDLFKNAALCREWLTRAGTFYYSVLQFKPALLVVSARETTGCAELDFYKGAFYFYQFCQQLKLQQYQPLGCNWIQQSSPQALSKALPYLNKAIACGSLPAIEAKILLLTFKLANLKKRNTRLQLLSGIKQLLRGVIDTNMLCGAYLIATYYPLLGTIFKTNTPDVVKAITDSFNEAVHYLFSTVTWQAQINGFFAGTQHRQCQDWLLSCQKRDISQPLNCAAQARHR